MPTFLLSLAVQVALVVHVIKTGRDQRWIFLIVFLPIVGALAYIVVELLPGYRANLTTRRALRRISRAVDPERDLRQHHLEYQRSQNVNSTHRLAEELSRAGRHDEAAELYRNALIGVFEHDPVLLLGLARVLFEVCDHRGAREQLDLLIGCNPDFKSSEGHLLYARSLESEGDIERARTEYETLAGYYPGMEARVRLALMEKAAGKIERARAMMGRIIEDAEIAPAHFRKAQKEWLDIARREA